MFYVYVGGILALAGVLAMVLFFSWAASRTSRGILRRRELLRIRLRHSYLLDERAKVGHDSPEWNELTRQMDELLTEVNRLENERFGSK